jgi:alkanesulfonate monooxygenase SsuD/methylene tetrahydromethanopterin reductase-like flavin-dependent oxidoreductase (luciferase family)
MRLGVSLAHVGRLADPASVRSAAVSAEHVGYSSLWVLDRPLAPVARRDPAEDDPPAEPSPVLDPLAALAYAAAVTTRVRLGTSVLVAPWHRPVLRARQLTSLDVLSDGRLTVGLRAGRPPDESDSLVVSERALDEALDVLGAAWGTDPAPRDSRYQRTVSSWTGPDRAQKPRPPILLEAYTRDGLDRVARRADGWSPVGPPGEHARPAVDGRARPGGVPRT